MSVPSFLDNVDSKALQDLFKQYDIDNDGKIALDEVEDMLVKLGVAPMKDPFKGRGSASNDKQRVDLE